MGSIIKTLDQYLRTKQRCHRATWSVLESKWRFSLLCGATKSKSVKYSFPRLCCALSGLNVNKRINSWEQYHRCSHLCYKQWCNIQGWIAGSHHSHSLSLIIKLCLLLILAIIYFYCDNPWNDWLVWTCLTMFHRRWQGCHVSKRSFLCPPPVFCPLFIPCRTWSCQSRSLPSSKTCWRGCCRETFPRDSAVRAKGIVHAPTGPLPHMINNHIHTNRCTHQVCVVSCPH